MKNWVSSLWKKCELRHVTNCFPAFFNNIPERASWGFIMISAEELWRHESNRRNRSQGRVPGDHSCRKCDKHKSVTLWIKFCPVWWLGTQGLGVRRICISILMQDSFYKADEPSNIPTEIFRNVIMLQHVKRNGNLPWTVTNHCCGLHYFHWEVGGQSSLATACETKVTHLYLMYGKNNRKCWQRKGNGKFPRL